MHTVLKCHRGTKELPELDEEARTAISGMESQIPLCFFVKELEELHVSIPASGIGQGLAMFWRPNKIKSDAIARGPAQRRDYKVNICYAAYASVSILHVI